jgi:hypothetical protein
MCQQGKSYKANAAKAINEAKDSSPVDVYSGGTRIRAASAIADYAASSVKVSVDDEKNFHYDSSSSSTCSSSKPQSSSSSTGVSELTTTATTTTTKASNEAKDSSPVDVYSGRKRIRAANAIADYAAS